MRSPLLVFALLCVACSGAEPPSGATVFSELEKLSLDPQQTYRVRELELTHGDVKIYLTEGILSFAVPVAGRVVAAVFTTAGAEAGDAEFLCLPPQRSERASLASFTKSPNLDEHFSSAVFFFTDDTPHQLLNQIQERPIRKAPELAEKLSSEGQTILHQAVEAIAIPLVRGLLDAHRAENGLFYGVIGAEKLGVFDVLYDPGRFEPILIGRPARPQFQLWTSFRPRRAGPYVQPAPRITGYAIDSTIRPDLDLAATASFEWKAGREDGRTAPFLISEALKVNSATIDGNPAEVFAPPASMDLLRNTGGNVLLIARTNFPPGSLHRMTVRYEGSVIRRSPDGSYFVSERNLWYPHTLPMLTNFDLTFRFPKALKLVSTGQFISESTQDDVRTTERRTEAPLALVGFNLGDYKVSSAEHGPYRVEAYADSDHASTEGLNQVLSETGRLLEYYTSRWTQLPIRTVAVSPVSAPFGQGFPGMIYLSTLAYAGPNEHARSPAVEKFAEILLPHEVAHQWWGNIVVPAEYRTTWLAEAMANYAALQFLDTRDRQVPIANELDAYRTDLLKQYEGETVESAGPVTLGSRLLETRGPSVWHTILYEKGSWILHMLHERLGEDAWKRMQQQLLREFSDKPITNEDFRRVASGYVPAGQPDPSLSVFFDAWVYGTGIPKLSLRRNREGTSIDVSDVDESFVADIPLHCPRASKAKQTQWFRLNAGANSLETNLASCQLPSQEQYLYSQ